MANSHSHQGPHGTLPAVIVGVAAWLIPGGGHLFLGQRGRGVTILITIASLYALGLLIGGIAVVDPPSAATWPALQAKPWFIVQALAGMLTIISTIITNAHHYPVSHAHSWEIGTLYTAVAGMLNLLALIDACARAAEGPEELAAPQKGKSTS